MNPVVSRKGQSTGFRRYLLAGTLMSVLFGCGGPSTGPEEALRDWVQHGVDAVEKKDRRELMGMISPAYTDTRGYDRGRVESVFRVYFLRMNVIQLLTSIDEITVIDDSAAEVLLTVGMAGTHDGFMGFSADAYQFALELTRDGDDWQLISARWGELGKELR